MERAAAWRSRPSASIADTLRATSAGPGNSHRGHGPTLERSSHVSSATIASAAVRTRPSIAHLLSRTRRVPHGLDVRVPQLVPDPARELHQRLVVWIARAGEPDLEILQHAPGPRRH